MFISNLTHFLDEKGNIPIDLPMLQLFETLTFAMGILYAIISARLTLGYEHWIKIFIPH